MMQQSIGEGSRADSRSRMNNHASRLLDNQEILILIYYRQWKGFGSKSGWFGQRERAGDRVALLQLLAGFNDLPVKLEGSLLDMILNLSPAELLQHRGQQLVQALAGFLECDYVVDEGGQCFLRWILDGGGVIGKRICRR